MLCLSSFYRKSSSKGSENYFSLSLYTTFYRVYRRSSDEKC
nr:MAG TPA: hypothetical protein [Caudoviricetes sp.]